MRCEKALNRGGADVIILFCVESLICYCWATNAKDLGVIGALSLGDF